MTKTFEDWTVQESYSAIADKSIWLIVTDRGLMLAAFDTKEEAERVLPGFIAAAKAGGADAIEEAAELVLKRGKTSGSNEFEWEMEEMADEIRALNKEGE